MKLLVATKEGQGGRGNDFSFTKEGELVYLGWTCDRDVGKADGGCGCGRSFSGLETHTGTTTARIAEVLATPESFEAVLRASLTEVGWLPGIEKDEPRLVADMADELVQLAAGFRMNDVLEKRGETIQVRGRAFGGR